MIDDGSGIARGDVSKIFEPFYTTKPPGEGTGLGLTTVHGVVTDSGGTVALDSAPGRGTTVRSSRCLPIRKVQPAPMSW